MSDPDIPVGSILFFRNGVFGRVIRAPRHETKALVYYCTLTPSHLTYALSLDTEGDSIRSVITPSEMREYVPGSRDDAFDKLNPGDIIEVDTGTRNLVVYHAGNRKYLRNQPHEGFYTATQEYPNHWKYIRTLVLGTRYDG